MSLHKVAYYKNTLKDHVVLTKPGIVALVLVTTLTGIYLANRGLPDPFLVFWTLIGTGFAAAGSAVLNNFIDRDIDRLMERTMSRPTAQGTVNPWIALFMGSSFILLSFFILSHYVNLISAFLAFLAAFIYVVPYTIVTKRRTEYATEIGGITGALPPVIGYTAVSGNINLEAFILFLIMFIWQPPHFWVLALKYREDYRRAGVATLPVSRGVRETKLRTLFYTLLLLPVTLLPYYMNMAGTIYLYGAIVLNIIYIVMTIRFVLSKKEVDMKLFFYSIFYLASIFTLMVIDMVRL